MAKTAAPADQRDSWSEGLSQLSEAVRLNVTASRAAAAGMVALGAAATAYFWDPQRRNSFLDSTRKWTDDATSWWNSFGTGATTPQQ